MYTTSQLYSTSPPPEPISPEPGSPGGGVPGGGGGGPDGGGGSDGGDSAGLLGGGCGGCWAAAGPRSTKVNSTWLEKQRMFGSYGARRGCNSRGSATARSDECRQAKSEKFIGSAVFRYVFRAV